MPYPSTFDNLPATSRGQPVSSANESAQADSINAIEQALGLNPQASYGTIASFIAALLGAARIPTGSISLYAGPTANIPAGYLPCDGRSLSQTTYSALFAVIGTTYGGGSGNFNLPDLQGRIPVAKGPAPFGALANKGGEEAHTLALNELPTHNHTFSGQWMDVTTGSNDLNNGSALNLTYFTSSTTTSAGGLSGVTQPHNNIQPFVVLNYMIYTQ